MRFEWNILPTETGLGGIIGFAWGRGNCALHFGWVSLFILWGEPPPLVPPTEEKP